MKKKIIMLISIIILLIASFLIGTGFRKRTDVVLGDFAVSEDGSKITLHVGVASSMGYIRNFGFGSKTGIDLNGEGNGIFPRFRHGSHWCHHYSSHILSHVWRDRRKDTDVCQPFQR